MDTVEEKPFLEFDEGAHVYYLNGEEIVSCTQVLKEVGAVDVDYFTPEHARRGTLVHALTQFWDAPLPSPEEMFPATHDSEGECFPEEISKHIGFAPTQQEMDTAGLYTKQYVKLRENVHFEIMPEGIERKVFCPVHRYAARLDRHIKLRAPCLDVALAEIKTNQSGYLPKWTGLQLAAQGHALAPNELFRRFAFILTPEKYIIHEYPVEEFINDRDTFLSMVRSVRWMRANA